MNKRLAFMLGPFLLLGASVQPVLAQGPPVMPPITDVVDTSTLTSEIASAGAAILILGFGVSVAFALAWKLKRRLTGAV